MQYVVTGGAGFIGSTLVDRLLADGHRVRAFDDLSSGSRAFLDEASSHAGFDLVVGELADRPLLTAACEGADGVFHLAANADVRFGLDHPSRDLERNAVGTHHVLEAMRAAGVGRIAFTSTGSVYGEPSTIPTPEDAPFPLQTSLYGASKLAAEGLVSAYCTGFGMQATTFRLVSALGERYHHGHVIDFCRQLAEHPDHLDVLGDGQQRKSYLYVGDCVDGLARLFPGTGAVADAPGTTTVVNLGTDEVWTVVESVAAIAAALGLDPEVRTAGGTRGWIGDSPHIHLDCQRARGLGWTPQVSVADAIERTVADLVARGVAPGRP